MATDDVKLVLGAVDNVTNVLNQVEKRVAGIGKNTDKLNLLASLGRAGAAANALGAGLGLAADTMKALRSDSENVAEDLYAAIEKLPMGFGLVATQVKNIVGELTGVNKLVEENNRLIAEADKIMSLRLASLDFRSQIQDELNLRQQLASETDATAQAIIRMRAAEAKQLDEINQKIRERNDLPDVDRERLKNLALEVQKTTTMEINRLLQERLDSENEALAKRRQEESDRIRRELDAATRYADTLADLDSEINAMRLRAMGDTEAAEIESINRRYQRQIDEALRANEAEKAARLGTLRDLELAEVGRGKAPGKARLDTLPELRAIESRLGRSGGPDPVARAAQQTAANTAKLGSIDAKLGVIIQNQSQPDTRVEAKL